MKDRASLILLTASALATLLSCTITFGQPNRGYADLAEADSCDTSRPTLPSIRKSKTLADVWEHQVKLMLSGTSTISANKEQIHARVEAIDGDIRRLCGGPKLQVHKSDDMERSKTAVLCVHEFTPSRIGAPPSVLNPEPLVLLHQREKERIVRWLATGSSIGSRTSALKVKPRRLSPLNHDTTLVWLEIEEDRTDFRSQDPKSGESTVMVETKWTGYILSLRKSDSMLRFVTSIPVMHQTAYGSEENRYVAERQQIDVHLYGDSRIQVSARTDSLTQPQTCVLGTHDLADNEERSSRH